MQQTKDNSFTNEKKIKEQEDILQCNTSLIVSASAGSGKTTVMIKKIYSYIASGECDVNNLLVLTYTNLAASEMKKKLIDKLKENLNENPNLIKQIELIPTSDISTFDSFCQRLVKKYFYILGIDPTFNILDAGEKQYYQNMALDLAILQFKKESPEEFETIINNFAKKRDEELVKSVILKIYDYIISLLNADEFFEKTLKLYKREEKIAENYLKLYYFEIFNQLKINLNNYLIVSNNYGFDKYAIYINNLISIIDSFLLTKDFTKIIELSSNIDYGRLKEDNLDEIGLYDSIYSAKAKLKLTIDELRSFGDIQKIDASYEKCLSLITSIISLEKAFIEKYDALKHSKNTYDFNDIERMTIKLLENEKICEQVKNCYKHIFVDEFQDANAVQEKIINFLDNKNLFFVGDTKQSIYAFRQSDPEIFLNIQKNFEDKSDANALFLNCNFRTQKHILEFVNNIFNVLMTPNTSGIDYKLNAQFKPEAEYEDLPNETCVELTILNEDKEKIALEPNVVYDVKEHLDDNKTSNTYKNECLLICNKIVKLLNEDIYDKDEKKAKRIKLEDITILVSKHGAFLNELISALDKYEIPYNVDMGEKLEDEYDCRVLFGLISLCVNGKDDYNLYRVLTSKLFDFSDGELSEIRLNSNAVNFYDVLKEYSQKDNKLAQKINSFYSTLSNFKFNCTYNGIYYALNKIIHDTNYVLKIDSNDFNSRISSIKQYVDSFVGSKFNHDVNGYVLFKQMAQENRLSKIQDKSADNAVNITTMHSSKGLEYPVVILLNLDNDYTKNKEEHEIKINKEFGIGVKAYDDDDRSVKKGIFYDAVNKKNKQLEQSEKIRLLYVAMTRAKNKLILIGRNKGGYKKLSSTYEIMSQNNFLSLIVGSLDKDIIDKINAKAEFSESVFGDKRTNINCISNVQIISRNTKEEELVFNDNLSKQQLLNYLTLDLSKNKVNLALKNSVSGFAFDNSSINFAPNKLSISEHLLETPSDKGTLYHKILENINFNNVNSVGDVKQFIECNLSEDEKNLFSDIPYENVFNNIQVLKQYTHNAKNILKEQKFVMNVKHCDLVDGGYENKILVQGIIDMVAVFDDKILLIDYKLSHKPNLSLKEHYKKQLAIYKLALSKRFKEIPIVSKILNLYTNELIDINE